MRYLEQALADIRKESTPPKTMRAENLFKLNEAVFNLTEEDVVDKALALKLFQGVEKIHLAYTAGKYDNTDSNFFYDYLALLGTMQNQHFFTEKQTEKLLSWIKHVVDNSDMIPASLEEPAPPAKASKKSDAPAKGEKTGKGKKAPVEDYWEEPAPKKAKSKGKGKEEPPAKGKGKGKAKEEPKGKGKGKEGPKAKGKGKAAEPEPKGKGKGKGKAEEPKSKSKRGKKADDYWEEPPPLRASKGKGKGKAEEPPAKGKGKGKGKAEPPAKGKGKDKGKGKGKAEEPPAKGKGKGKGKAEPPAKGKGKDKGKGKGNKGKKRW
eukprot:TRINITY_DN1656_c0_g1_i2.p1 TRINITY_DN1656_c0_g1~~TRINITY_DN1656_c0_g1_i2.p1  ORF type:complete len:321 (-),score=150.49 TRINITY_DN1656_c0_g1_i2:56-1018(-)